MPHSRPSGTVDKSNDFDGEVRFYKKEIEGLQNEAKNLKAELEKEQEWKLHESNFNVQQADYEKLVKAARYMTDEEAKDWICGEFGFDRSKITILHEIDEEEINRHRQCRRTGRKIDRRPAYCATDYHYIRFDVSNWYYEAWNGQLHQFYR